MIKDSNSSSSAPKICAFSKKLAKVSCKSIISPGISPSYYTITNFPLASSFIKENKAFFDASMSISELKLLGEINSIDVIDSLNCESIRKTKSASNTMNPCNYFGNKIPKTRKMDSICNTDKISELDDEITNNKILFIGIDELKFPCIKLQNPPVCRNRRRIERSTHQNQTISSEKITGVLKNYNLKKRFGFVKTENAKIFVCEDELILSGINYKHFKDKVFSKAHIILKFHIKIHNDNGKNMQKAVNIEIES